MGEGDVTYEYNGVIEGDFGGCAECAGGGCSTCCGWSLPVVYIPLPYLRVDNLSVWAGVYGAKNPSHLGEGAGFGFEEGLNFGGCLPGLSNHGLSYQFGLNVVQSELSGNEFTSSSRDQYYFTGGIFRRVDWGLQGGVVIDYLKDQWYFDSYELTQLRAEVSWVYPCLHEIGFMYSGALRSGHTFIGQAGPIANPTLTTRDIYSLFYRRRFASCNGGELRFYGGLTDRGDGVLGGNVSVPMNDCWALNAAFNYLIPEEGNGPQGDFNEGWFVGIRMVWTPGGNGCGNQCDYNRPLFDVANPGLMMLDLR